MAFSAVRTILLLRSPLVPVVGRHRARALTKASSFSARYFSRIGAGAVTRSWWSWFIAAVRALTADRRATCRARRASICSVLGALVARPDNTAWAAW